MKGSTAGFGSSISIPTSALEKAVRDQDTAMCLSYRKPTTSGSIPLEWRLSYGQLRYHAGPTCGGSSREHGDELGVFFRMFLACIKEGTDGEGQSFLSRIKKNQKGEYPRASVDPVVFHMTYWKYFRGIPFTELSIEEKCAVFQDFLQKKFSVDPYGKAMLPPAHRRPKKLSWEGFWLSDTELNEIMRKIHLWLSFIRNE